MYYNNQFVADITYHIKTRNNNKKQTKKHIY